MVEIDIMDIHYMSVNENETSNHETPPQEPVFYRFQFREGGQQFTGAGPLPGLIRGTVVMVETDHGLEPARIAGYSPICGCQGPKGQASYVIDHVAQGVDLEKYVNLEESEKVAFKVCKTLIEKHKLGMHLVRVERFFSGSKMIFYFTADSRVDFRALVKDLVQEFRTRVEMRQVGVRHETKMIGGIGTCGRELCCSSYIKNFDSVSIKMAKEQDLPLNPTKISGVCNRLLCCLTYEYETYKKQRKNMPKAGKRIKLEGDQYLVKRQMPLQDAVIAENSAGEDVMLKKEQWELSQPFLKDTPEKKKEKKKSK
jgi:cell fate regulator YaaT (PSP1 superfamily)